MIFPLSISFPSGLFPKNNPRIYSCLWCQMNKWGWPFLSLSDMATHLCLSSFHTTPVGSSQALPGMAERRTSCKHHMQKLTLSQPHKCWAPAIKCMYPFSCHFKHFQPVIKACSHPFCPEKKSTAADLVILEAWIPWPGAGTWFSGTELAEEVNAFSLLPPHKHMLFQLLICTPVLTVYSFQNQPITQVKKKLKTPQISVLHY